MAIKSLDDALKSRADDFDLGRGEQLVAIQEVLNEMYPGRIRAKKLNDGVLSITTPSSVLAGHLRLSQTKLVNKLKRYGVESLRIRIE